MIFAAKEAVEKKAMAKGRQEGQKAERERIEQGPEALEKSGVTIPPEIARESSPANQPLAPSPASPPTAYFPLEFQNNEGGGYEQRCLGRGYVAGVP